MTAVTIPSEQKIDVIIQDETYSIRKCDWKRIKRMAKNISKPPKFIQISYSILLGISGSAFISLIPLYSTSNLDDWIIPTYWIIAILTLFISLILIFIEKKLFKDQKSQLDSLNEEFREIESLY